MLNNSVVTFNDNFGLIFEGQKTRQLMAPKIGLFRLYHTLNGRLLTRQKVSNIGINLTSPETSLRRAFLLLRVWKYLCSFLHSCLPKRDRKI